MKRRNGTDLEIKRREKRKKRGAEKWRKTKVEAVDNDTWISCEKQRAKCTLPPPHDGIKVEVADVRFENGSSSKSIAFEKGKPHELYAACGSVMGLGEEWTADDWEGALGSSGFVGGYPTALLRFVSSPDERRIPPMRQFFVVSAPRRRRLASLAPWRGFVVPRLPRRVRGASRVRAHFFGADHCGYAAFSPPIPRHSS